MEARLTLALTLGVPILIGVAALAALFRPTRATVSVLLLGAVIDAFVGIVTLPSVRRGVDLREATVGLWSPLGLYGVELSVRTDALGSFLAVPCVVAALAGWIRAYGPPWRDLLSPRHPTPSPRVDAALLVALAGGVWVLMAGDLLSMVLGTGTLFVATAGALRLAHASVAARWRLVVTGGFSLCLLACMLLLGKVNGSFATSQLASVSFSDASLAGLVIVAYGVGNAVPFHGWALLLSRQPLLPAVGAVGSAVSLALVDVAFITTRGELADAWREILTALGVVAVLGAVMVAWGTRHPRLRLATLAGGRTGLGLLAIASGAPATMSALALLHGVATMAAALLWVGAPGGRGQQDLRSQQTRAHHHPSMRHALTSPLPRQVLPPATRFVPPARSSGAGPGLADEAYLYVAPTGRGESLRGRGGGGLRIDAWRNAGPWLVVLVVATAAGLPGTIGGLAADTYLTALAASSDAGGWLRTLALVLDTATIGVGGAVLAAGIDAALRARVARSFAHGGTPVGVHAGDAWRASGTLSMSLRDALPWLGVSVGIVLVVAPALLPVTFVGPWFGPISVAVAGTSSPSRLVDALRIASPDRIVLTLAAAIALYRTQRGDEMLPAPVRALLGIAVLLMNPLVGLARAVFGGLQGSASAIATVSFRWIERVAALARLVEERYYAAVTVVVMIVLIYSVGR